MRIYLSGPISNMPELNRPAFEAAAIYLRRRGHVVFNPHELFTEDQASRLKWEDFMRLDIVAMAQFCDAVAVLPGWAFSTGARGEVAVGALLFKMPILDAATLEPIDELDMPQII